MTTHWKFKLGERVQRRVDVYDQNSPMRRGKVVRQYEDLDSRFGPYPELYKVMWDDSVLSSGYLRHGLQSIEGMEEKGERVHTAANHSCINACRSHFRGCARHETTAFTECTCGGDN